MTYFAVIQPESDGACRIELPGFREPDIARSSMHDVERAARRAVLEALARCASEGEAPPQAIPKEELECRPEYRRAFLVRVEVSAGGA